MIIAYTIFNFIVATGLLFFILKLYRGTPFLYTQLLNFYSFFFVFISLSVLEYGFYITESLNYSYLNGAALVFLLFLFAFFILLKLFINLFTSINSSQFAQINTSYGQKKKLALSLLILSQIFMIVLLINLMLSPIPFFSPSVNRLTFWDHAYIPLLGVILGERSIPLVISLGVLFNFYNINNKSFLKKVTLVSFAIYLVYLILLGHKFSPIMIAFFLFYLPTMIMKRTTFKSIIKKSILIFLVLVTYVIYTYTKIESGIVSSSGGAVGGALYRIFILQGHVFWNMFSQADSLRVDSWNNLSWLIANKFDGLKLTMYLVSPDLAESYLASGVRFTSGFPGFLFALPLLFIIIFTFSIIAIYAFILTRLVALAKLGSIIRLFIYILFLYFFHFGFSMGDFRFLFSNKFLMFLSLLLFIEVVLLRPRIKSVSRHPSLPG